MRIAKSFLFDAAHKIYRKDLSEKENKKIFGKCYNLHGHTYKLEITVEGHVDKNGMVMNFAKLKKEIDKRVINILDHSYLNDYIEVPTCENTIKWIVRQLPFHKYGKKTNIVPVHSIKLYETPTSYAEEMIC